MRLDEAQIEEWMGRIPSWHRVGETIVRKLRLPSFKDAIDFTNHVADLAEQQDHHPDILIQWRDVTLTLSTHSAGGLTELDFDLAERIDRQVGA